ncbi:MAG: LacI family DNA-binding transcriptional regulator [Anaerolineaceae bacterium]|nr:MAG: LacI family DNA-binding transcriptional regulator [Anaerolineaceae bacterium]
MQKRVTATDVAELAGVSRTTVSFVLNNVPGMRISEETRRKVLEAAQQLDYHPNISAQRLVTGQTRIIAYVERQTPEQAFSDAFLPQVLRGVHDAATASNYEVLFAPVPVENGAERCEYLLRGGHVDGIILSGPRSDDLQLRDLLERGAPLVLQGHWPGVATASVDIDNREAARMAVKHLIGLNHRQLGMIVHAPLAYTAAASRLHGYRDIVESNGLSVDESCIAEADFTPESGERAMEALLQCDPPPTAIFASSDTVAIGAMREAKRMGYRIPEDMSFVGFDDIPMAVYQDPPLTTVRLPAYGLGWAAADLLIRLIAQEEVRERNLLLESELIIRASCGAEL